MFFRKWMLWIYITTYFRHIYAPLTRQTDNVNMLVLSHRNGAVDAFVYSHVFKRGIYLVAKQLQRNFFLKFIFPGIAVYRKKDKKEKSQSNSNAIKECLNVLKAKKEPLCIFPEGTSTLGPKHLPFFDGYAKMAYADARSGHNTILLPSAIIYDDPTCLGGSVWVIYGEKVKVTKNMSLKTIQKETLASFENVVLSYPSEQEQLVAHQLSIIASLSKKMTYYECMKKAQNNKALSSLIKNYRKNIPQNAFCYKKTIIYPQNFWNSLWVFLITFPIVMPTLIFNILPISVAYFFGQTRKDDPNTITLWRTLTGYPTAFLFYFILLLICPKLTILMALFSIWGFHLYGAFKKHTCALMNFIFYHFGYTHFKEIQNAIMSKF